MAQGNYRDAEIFRSKEDEEIYQRILARKKKAAKRRRRKRIRRRLLAALIVILLILIGIFGTQYYRNLMVAGGDILDGDAEIVTTAKGELGNYAGEKFWSWYGFDYQVDWCACFVSWCADQNGLLDSGEVPLSCYVPEMLNWYRYRDLFLEGGETPAPGYIIFFDWDHDDYVDHVGIVAGVYKDRIFTIEGNTGYSQHEGEDDWYGECMRMGYNIDSEDILGYGIVTSYQPTEEESE